MKMIAVELSTKTHVWASWTPQYGWRVFQSPADHVGMDASPFIVARVAQGSAVPSVATVYGQDADRQWIVRARRAVSRRA